MGPFPCPTPRAWFPKRPSGERHFPVRILEWLSCLRLQPRAVASASASSQRPGQEHAASSPHGPRKPHWGQPAPRAADLRAGPRGWRAACRPTPGVSWWGAGPERGWPPPSHGTDTVLLCCSVPAAATVLRPHLPQGNRPGSKTGRACPRLTHPCRQTVVQAGPEALGSCLGQGGGVSGGGG